MATLFESLRKQPVDRRERWLTVAIIAAGLASALAVCVALLTL